VAEEQTGQERTEQPTERRKQEARRKGQVPRSRELNTMLSLLALSLSLLFLGEGLVARFLAMARHGLQVDRALAFNAEQLPIHLMQMLVSAVLILWPVFLVAVIAAFAGPLLMGGWAFSAEAMAFKLEKLNPVKGLGRVFSAKGLLELVKALIKFFLLLAATLLIFALVQRDMLGLSLLTPGGASHDAVNLLVWGLLGLSGTMAFIVVFDVPFELWNHNRQLRMTRQEVRDELKETDGRPEVRQRIRNLQREVSQRRMMQDVPTADVVITNPTHVAVALSYGEGGARAPVVVARGKDLMALQIRRIAAEHGVPLYEAPPLARALYASTDIGEEIPQSLYLAVARVLAYLYQLRRAGPTDYVPPPQDLEVPDEYRDIAEENDDGE
jgi:flagellar biosynthetic protein FlhB